MEFCSWGPLYLRYFRGENCRCALCLGGQHHGLVARQSWQGRSLRRVRAGPFFKTPGRLLAPAGLVGLRASVALELVLYCHLLSAVK